MSLTFEPEYFKEPFRTRNITITVTTGIVS
jgi:hypothetical protein